MNKNGVLFFSLMKWNDAKFLAQKAKEKKIRHLPFNNQGGQAIRIKDKVVTRGVDIPDDRVHTLFHAIKKKTLEDSLLW